MKLIRSLSSGGALLALAALAGQAGAVEPTNFVRYYEALKEGKGFTPLFCFPEGLTRNQAIEAYVAYSKAHPEYDQEAVGDVIMKFLVDTYPCAKAPEAKKP